MAASGCRTFAPTCARIFARVCPSLWASPLPLNVDDTLIEDDRLYLLDASGGLNSDVDFDQALDAIFGSVDDDGRHG